MMVSLGVVRGFLLFMAVLALLTATVLDGIMMRRVVKPMLELGERRTGAPLTPPRPLRYMIEHAWARRVYHLLFAVVLFGLWWHLGPGSSR
jgi:hypothetical protein